MKDFVFLLLWNHLWWYYPRYLPLYQLFYQNKDCGSYVEATSLQVGGHFHIEILAKRFWDMLLHHVFPEMNRTEDDISDPCYQILVKQL